MAIANGSWSYDTGEILTPTTTLQTTSSWTLTGTTCKKFTITISTSGILTVYANSTIDTYGYIGTTDSSAISSSGAPTYYDYYNDDDGDNYGGTPSTAFGFQIPVIKGQTYYLWVRPYSSSKSAETTISYQITEPPKMIAQYLKIDASTWVKINNPPPQAEDAEFVPSIVTIDITASNISQYFTVSNGSYYFAGSGNTFTSNNKGQNSTTATTTFTAKYDMDITFNYSYGGESNYDKFSLVVGSTTLANALSGSNTSSSYTGTIATGTKITLTYSKDGSQSSYQDCGTISNIKITGIFT